MCKLIMMPMLIMLIVPSFGCDLFPVDLGFVTQRQFFDVDEVRSQCLAQVGIPDGLENPKSFNEEDLKVLADSASTETDTTAALAATMLGFDRIEVNKVADLGNMMEDIIDIVDEEFSDDGDCQDCCPDCQQAPTGRGLMTPSSVLVSKAIKAMFAGAPRYVTDTACDPEVTEPNGNIYASFVDCPYGGGTLEIRGDRHMVDMVTEMTENEGFPGELEGQTGFVTIIADHLLMAEEDEISEYDPNNDSWNYFNVLTGYTEIDGSIGIEMQDVSLTIETRINSYGSEEPSKMTVSGTVIVNAIAVKISSSSVTDKTVATVPEGSLDGEITVHIDTTIDLLEYGMGVELRLFDVIVEGLVLEVLNDPQFRFEFSGQVSGTLDWREEENSRQYEDNSQLVPAGVVNTEHQKLNVDGVKIALGFENDKGTIQLDADLSGSAANDAKKTYLADGGKREGTMSMDLPCEMVALRVSSNSKGTSALLLEGYGSVSGSEGETWNSAGSQRFDETSLSTVRIEATMGDLSASLVLPQLTMNESRKETWNNNESRNDRTDVTSIPKGSKAYVEGKDGAGFYLYTQPSMQDVETRSWINGVETGDTQSTGKLIMEGAELVEMMKGDTEGVDTIIYLDNRRVEP